MLPSNTGKFIFSSFICEMTLFLCSKISVAFDSKSHDRPFSRFLNTCANRPCSLATVSFESNSNLISPSLLSAVHKYSFSFAIFSLPFSNSVNSVVHSLLYLYRRAILVESRYIRSSNWVSSLSKSDLFIGTINKVLACLM